MSIILSETDFDNSDFLQGEEISLEELRARATSYWESKEYQLSAQHWRVFRHRLDAIKAESGTHSQFLIEAFGLEAVCLAYLGEVEKANALVAELIQLHLPVKTEEEVQVSHLYNRLGELLFPRGLYSASRQVCLAALELAQKKPKEYSHALTRTRNNLSAILIMMRQLKEAEEILRSNLAELQRSLGARNANVATLMNNLGELLRQQGRYQEAGPFLEEALRIRKEILGEEHQLVVQSANNLAFLYLSQGWYQSATKLFLSALEQRRQKSLSTDSQLASTLIGLGEAYLEQGFPHKAEVSLEEALKIIEEIEGKNHLRTAYLLTLLANAYRLQKKTTLAEKTVKRSEEIHQEKNATDRPQYAALLMAQAKLKLGESQGAEAEELIQKGLRIQVQTLGNTHPEIPKTLVVLAESFTKQSRDKRAKGLLTSAVDLAAKELGANHIGLMAPFTALAKVFSQRRNFDQAEIYARQALAIHSSAFEPYPLGKEKSLRQLFLAYFGQKKHSEAIATLKQLQNLQEDFFGSEHEPLILTLEQIAQYSLRDKKYKSTRDLLMRCLEIAEKCWDAHDPQIARISDGLAYVQIRLNNPKAVEELMTRALRIKERQYGIEDEAVIEYLKLFLERLQKMDAFPEKQEEIATRIQAVEHKSSHVLDDLL